MQSGIIPSPALHTALQTFSSTPTTFALLITIDRTSLTLEPLLTIPSSSSFHTSLCLLPHHLLPTRPLYLLLRRHASDPPFVMITYTPDAAEPFWKTLFASTKNTAAKAFGPGKIRAEMFATEKGELEWGEWERWERSEGVGGPLTGEEEAAKRVREGEEEAKSGGTRGEQVVRGKGMELRAEEAVMERLRELNSGEGANLVMLRIDRDTEIIELAGTATTDAEGLASQISDTEPRYSFWRCTNLAGAESSPPIVFIYTCPSGSKPKDRMIYATSKTEFVARAEKITELSIVKRLEASDPSEITGETIEDELRPKQVQKQAFARPKRPGKR